MKTLFILLSGLLSLACLNTLSRANAQTKPTVATRAAKSVTMTGTVSADEKTFIADKNKKIWTVTNPDVLKGHAGHHISIAAKGGAASDLVTVKSIQVLTHEPPTNGDDKLRFPRPAKY